MTEDYYVDVDFHTHKPFAPEKMWDILGDLDEYGAAGGVSPDGKGGSISLTVEATDKEHAKSKARLIVEGVVTQRAPEGAVVTSQVEAVRTEEEINEYLGGGPDWFDAVNSPAHYAWLPVEPIEILEHLNFNRGAACKYIIRAGRKSKDTEIEDLEKALYHIRREIERVKGEG